jgi:hypothetical protein
LPAWQIHAQDAEGVLIEVILMGYGCCGCGMKKGKKKAKGKK